MANKIEIKKSRDNQYYVSLKASNGQKLANTETYTTKQNAKKAVAALKKVIENPKVIDMTK